MADLPAELPGNLPDELPGNDAMPAELPGNTPDELPGNEHVGFGTNGAPMSVGEPAKIEPAPPTLLERFNPIRGLEKLGKFQQKAFNTVADAATSAREYARKPETPLGSAIRSAVNPADLPYRAMQENLGIKDPLVPSEVADIALSNTIGRAWPYVQESVGKPMVEGLIKKGKELGLKASLMTAPEGSPEQQRAYSAIADTKNPANPSYKMGGGTPEYLVRKGLEFYGGEGTAPEKVNPFEAAVAQMQLEKKLGPVGSTIAEQGVGFAGQAPLMFLPGGKVTAAPSMVASMGEAAKLNYMFAQASRQDPYVASAVGMGLGGTFHLISKLPSSVARTFNAEDTALLRKQIWEAVQPTAEDFELGAASKAAKTPGPPVEFKNGAKPIGDPIAAGLSSTPNGGVKLREVWAKYVPEKHAVELQVHDTPNPSAERVAFTRDRIGLQSDISAAETDIESHLERAPEPLEAAVSSARGNAETVRERAASPNAVKVEPTPEEVADTAVVIRPKGDLSVVPLDKTPDVRPPSSPDIGAGDIVTLKHAGGDVPNARVLGVKNGEARVLLPGSTKPVDWPVSALHLAGPEAEAAHFSSFSAYPGETQLADLSYETIVDEVRRMGYVTASRLNARFPQRWRESAAAVMSDLIHDGVLKPGEGRGVFEPTSPVEAVPGGIPGTKVYYGKAGELTAGVYRGADVFRPGQHEIEIEPGKKISLPASEFNTARPITLGRKDLANLPAQEGITSPLPPGVVAPQSPITQALAGTWTKVGTQLRGAGSYLENTLRHVFLNDVWNGPAPLWASKARVAVAQKNYEAHVQAVQRTLGAVGLNTPADLALRGVLDKQAGTVREAELQAWVKKYPQEAAGLQQTVKQLIDEAKMLEDQIAQLDPTGTIAGHEAARAMGSEGEYVRGLYNAHIMARGEWARWLQKQKPEVWNAASKVLIDELQANGFKGDLAAKASETMGEMLKTDPETALKNAGLSSKTAKTFTARETMKPEIRALLGESQSGTLGLAHTLATLRTQRSELAAWNDIADSMWWSRGPRQDLPVQVPQNARYGKAAGGFIPRSLEWMVNAHKSPEQGMALANALGRMWKANVTVFGGPGTWINNVMRNYPSAVYSGALDPAAPGEYHDAVREMAGLMLAYRKNPSVFGPAGILTEMQEFGALSPGMMSVEGSKFRGATERKVLASLQKNRGGLADGVMDFVQSARDSVDSVKEAYDAIDQVAKGSAYLVLRRRFMSEGLSVHDAAAKASLRVNQSFPNFSLPSPLARRMAANFGYAAPFATSKLEDLRIQGTTVARMGKEVIAAGQAVKNRQPIPKPELIGQMCKAGMVAAGFATWIAALRKANGITDEDIQKAYHSLPLTTRGYKPALVAMPSLDAKGNVHFVDLSGYLDPLMAARGSISDPLTSRLVLGTVNDLFGQGAFTTPINMVAARAGVAPMTARQNIDQASRGLPLRGDEGWKTLAAGASAGAMLPQFPVRLNSALQQGGVIGSQPATFTNQEMLAKMLGISVVPSGPEQQRITNMQLRRGVKDIQGDMVKGALQNKDDPEARQELLSKQRQMIKDLVHVTREE